MKKRALCPWHRPESFFRPFISFVFLIASFLVLPSLSFSEDTVTIESTGSSVISTDNAAFARDAAIAEALRKALDQAAGTFVSSGTLVEDYNEAAEFSRFLISRSGRYRITGATLNTIEVEGAE